MLVKDSSITITLISKPRPLVPTPWEPVYRFFQVP